MAQFNPQRHHPRPHTDQVANDEKQRKTKADSQLPAPSRGAGRGVLEVPRCAPQLTLTDFMGQVNKRLLAGGCCETALGKADSQPPKFGGRW